MKVLKFIKSIISDLLGNLSTILLVTLGFAIISIMAVGIICILGIPIHILLFPQVVILDCGIISIFLIILIWSFIGIIIELIKYLKKKWNES